MEKKRRKWKVSLYCRQRYSSTYSIRIGSGSPELTRMMSKLSNRLCFPQLMYQNAALDIDYRG